MPHIETINVQCKTALCQVTTPPEDAYFATKLWSRQALLVDHRAIWANVGITNEHHGYDDPSSGTTSTCAGADGSD